MSTTYGSEEGIASMKPDSAPPFARRTAPRSTLSTKKLTAG